MCQGNINNLKWFLDCDSSCDECVKGDPGSCTNCKKGEYLSISAP